jgi:hypothetical protein
MQNRPDHPTLLEAVARFLLESVSPALEADKALQFRVLIAANLAGVVASELKTDARRFDAEAGRLVALLPELNASGLKATDAGTRTAALEMLNRELARRLREAPLDASQLDALTEHLFATAKETLEVTNPRFDLADEP